MVRKKVTAGIFWVCLFSVFDLTQAVPPKFKDVNLDPVITVTEAQRSIDRVANLDCENPDPLNPQAPEKDVVVKLDSVSPSTGSCSKCFQAYPGCGAQPDKHNSFCLKFLPVDTFNYRTTEEYTLTFSCTNTNGEAALQPYTIYIRLEPNTPPYFINTSPVSVDATKSKEAGDELFPAACIDSDPLQYGLTTDPVTDYFRIDASGTVRATRDLKSLCRNSITFLVTCKDAYNDLVGPNTIYASLEGANQQPSITGINYNKDVPEDSPVGTVLGTFSVTDTDDSLSCRIATNPPDSLQYYNLDFAETSIVVRSALNYEQTQTRVTNVTVICSDGLCSSSPAYLYIRVTDVNEPIDINPKDFTLSSYEGRIDIDPKWTPIDEDFNDDPTYTIVDGNTKGLFAINPTTGKITSTIDYDVDGGANPIMETIVVQVRDEAAHTSTTTVTLSILDRNDNRPTFDTATSQTFSIQDCNGAGTTPGKVTATDADSEYQGNNKITYSGSSGPLTIGPNGDVLIGAGITAGSTYTVQASARDAGQFPEPLSALTPATVTVTVTACPTPTPTTVAPTTTVDSAAVALAEAAAKAAAEAEARAKARAEAGLNPGGTISTSEANSANGTDENLGWIIFAALLGTVLLAALGYMLWRTCIPFLKGFCTGFCNGFSRDCCVARQTTRTSRITTVRETYRGNAPEAGNRGFWQERYPDDDYKMKDPLRNRVPTPANYEAGNSTWADMNQTSYSWRSGYQTSGLQTSGIQNSDYKPLF